MKPRRSGTDAVPTTRMTKSEANRENALRSTGPKTSRGKNHSKINALKHGLYSKELVISEADQPEFQEMRVELAAELEPRTALQWTAFDSIVACNWRCKLAMRLEQRQFARQFQSEQDANPQDEAHDEGGIKRWYGCSRSDVRVSIRGLEHAMMEFDEFGYFHEETKTFLKRGFGMGLFHLLEDWTPPMSKEAMLLAEHLAMHREKFGEPRDPSVPTLKALGETSKVVLDPKQSRNMVCKLLEERRNYLRELLTIAEAHTLDERLGAARGADFNPRFLADANRELRRALDWYLSLKDTGL